MEINKQRKLEPRNVKEPFKPKKKGIVKLKFKGGLQIENERKLETQQVEDNCKSNIEGT